MTQISSTQDFLNKFGRHLGKTAATKKFWLHVLLYAVLSAGAVLMIVPFLWMVSTAFKTEPEVLQYPPVWLPRHLTFDSFIKVWQVIPLGRFFFNSIFVGVVITASQVLLDSLAAYGFARRRFPGRDLIFMIFLTTMMVPRQVTMIPLFMMMRSIPFTGGNGWIDSYWGLIVPGLSGAFGVFLLRQFFITIPVELEEAARIDGCSSINIFFRIMTPLAKPALLSVGIFVFLWSWNDFIWPLIITNQVAMRTLPVGLSNLQGQYKISWSLLMAASVLATLPVVIAYLFFQREFVQGITLTGLKG